MKYGHYLIILLTTFSVISLGACSSSSGGGSTTPTPNAPVDLWTWISGSKLAGQSGVYGTKGMADAANVPGARENSVSWTDSNDNLWLFGGSGTGGDLNDLWKYYGTNWTWVSGSNLDNQLGIYGTKGMANAANVPGARVDSVSWIDESDNLWLFGGWGLDSAGAGTFSYLNDLWKFDGSNWTWVSGNNIANQSGTYGTKGMADAANAPGGRWASMGWVDSSNNLWLLGGVGSDSMGSYGYLNDLWKFDGVNWTWVSGSNRIDELSTYGTKGMANAANVPGARTISMTWVDASGNLWLFGGFGFTDASSGRLNDLWKFDGANWTWVSGSKLAGQSGVYGVKGVTNAANMPGGRQASLVWTDVRGNMWLFGGRGYDSAGTDDRLNDLWKFDGTNWTWVSGSNLASQSGVYGTKGVTDVANIPGGRRGSIAWTDSSGNFWLLGGDGYDESTPNFSSLNDLWRYEP